MNRKVILEWVRITGLTVSQKTNYVAVLLDFVQKILDWPVQAGFTNTGPAIREAYHAAKIKDEKVNLVKGKVVIGKEQPMRPTTAAMKLNLNMIAWQGEPLESMLCKQENEDIAKGAYVYGSLKLIGIDVSVAESSSTKVRNKYYKYNKE
ncbi:unnamed protein product [Heligmosomoides polygyrus]|uniref:Transposase n=1 Tax=Heligmosomoides polygyrus TaxID=6339 RepID=A0A183G626_HELPZ|nr:unnamed protein product [Heligmosomoides polygyrus]